MLASADAGELAEADQTVDIVLSKWRSGAAATVAEDTPHHEQRRSVMRSTPHWSVSLPSTGYAPVAIARDDCCHERRARSQHSHTSGSRRKSGRRLRIRHGEAGIGTTESGSLRVYRNDSNPVIQRLRFSGRFQQITRPSTPIR